jgi:hypothetical protein
MVRDLVPKPARTSMPQPNAAATQAYVAGRPVRNGDSFLLMDETPIATHSGSPRGEQRAGS